MKTIQRSLLVTLIAAASMAAARADHYVSAPVTIAVTLASNQGFTYSGNTASLKALSSKLSNRDFLLACVDDDRISSIDGWSIFMGYNADPSDEDPDQNPEFFLKHKNGETVSISDIIRMTKYATVGSGSLKANQRGTVSGSITESIFYRGSFAIHDSIFDFYGIAKQPLRMTGTTSSYYGISNGLTGTFTGYIQNAYFNTVTVSLKAGKFQ